MNNIYACGLLEDINIEPEQDMQDPSKINIRIKVEEVEAKSMEVCSRAIRLCGRCLNLPSKCSCHSAAISLYKSHQSNIYIPYIFVCLAFVTMGTGSL